LNPEAQRCVRSLIPAHAPRNPSGRAFAPSNIALCKYWGKRNEALKLPLTGSLSVSLGKLGSQVSIHLADQDSFQLNGEEVPPSHKARKRLFAYLDLFRQNAECFQVEAENTIPMGAGLASSASAFAAIAQAVDALYGWELSSEQLSILARMGSGSASRSIYEGFAEWVAGAREDGMDSYAVSIAPVWPEFRIGLLILSQAEKAVGSTEGMRRTRDSSSLFQSWPAQVERDLPAIRNAVLERDFSRLGQHAEQNALSMHATMASAWPPLIYAQPETLAVLHRVHTLRAEGLELYVTMDAGPNVKLLYLAQDREAVRSAFPEVQEVE